METNYSVLLPEIALAITGIVVMLAAPVFSRQKHLVLNVIALAGTLLALGLVIGQWGSEGLGFWGMVFQDNFGHWARLLFLFSTAVILPVAGAYLENENIRLPEFYALVLFSTVGMCLMVTSADLIMTFLGIEVLSIASYVLAGFRREEAPSESAWKYFILGAFSTAFLLYGIAFIYGVTGSTKYLSIPEAISGSQPLLLYFGVGLILVGFGFKAALVPFHIWTPDVYQGAPVPVTAHLAVASKAAAFLTLLRLLQQVFPGLGQDWQGLLWISAVLTMLLGNIAALSQTNIKRMLAYSSIAHAGYLLVGLAANNSVGSEAVLFYLASYAFMTLGAFAVVQILARREEAYVNLPDYNGLGYQHPFLCISLAVFLFSMAGIPATAGFLGKLFLFSAAIKSEMYWLVVLGLLATAIGVYYYLRVIVLMFMREAPSERQELTFPLAVRVIVTLMVIGTIGLGLFPEPLLQMVKEAIVF